jgi:type I restriction enzyme R subunit
MTNVSKPERATQERVIQLFTNALGYQYLGDWSDRAGNHCIEEGLLSSFLTRSGYSPAHVVARQSG